MSAHTRSTGQCGSLRQQRDDELTDAVLPLTWSHTTTLTHVTHCPQQPYKMGTTGTPFRVDETATERSRIWRREFEPWRFCLPNSNTANTIGRWTEHSPKSNKFTPPMPFSPAISMRFRLWPVTTDGGHSSDSPKLTRRKPFERKRYNEKTKIGEVLCLSFLNWKKNEDNNSIYFLDCCEDSIH